MSETDKKAKRTLVINSPRFLKLNEEIKKRFGSDRDGLSNPIINQILEEGLAIEEAYSTKLEYFINAGSREKLLISNILSSSKTKASDEMKLAMLNTMATVIGYGGDIGIVKTSSPNDNSGISVNPSDIEPSSPEDHGTNKDASGGDGTGAGKGAGAGGGGAEGGTEAAPLPAADSAKPETARKILPKRENLVGSWLVKN